MKIDRFEILSILFFTIMILSLPLDTPEMAQGKTDHKGMVDEIGILFNEALTSYRVGNKQEAKSKAQAAYFEVFENLEGPIRINISARINYELEEEFAGIRRMIVNEEPIQAVEKRIYDLMAQLRHIAVELEGGFELVAEPAEEMAQPAALEPAKTEKQIRGKIESIWLQALGKIQSELEKALEAYKNGNTKDGKDFVIQAQFDGYKNTLLETAVRRYVSQKKDYENNSAFSEIIGMIHKGESPEKVKMRITNLINALEDDLPGLPLVEGAVSKKISRKEVPDKDWSQITARLFAEIEKAIVFYDKGETKDAVTLVQDTYFDVFEASGMETKVGSRDDSLKARLESHFSMMVGQMKDNAPLGDILKTLKGMKADFGKAVNLLSKGAETPIALFFYSLMIILREGFEAILIITAIIAYLIKTGNKNKLGVIYNGCVSALLLSFLTAALVKWVFKVSAASQEIIEGATMLLASAVLFSVSYWLISKAEAQKWIAYIKGKVSKSLSSGSMKALWFAAFLAVYREGAETVLFYQALVTGTDSLGITAIGGGFGVGCALLVAIYLIMRYGTVKLPIRPFFVFTGGLLYYMAFVFAGKGMMELVSGKVFQPSPITWVPTIPFIGMYPYWQTVMAQIALFLAAITGFALIMKQAKTSERHPEKQA